MGKVDTTVRLVAAEMVVVRGWLNVLGSIGSYLKIVVELGLR